ncbi:MAG: hypothetical protein WCJ66_01820 [Verrucomicrobiota bacterium]
MKLTPWLQMHCACLLVGTVHAGSLESAYTARSVTVQLPNKRVSMTAELQSSTDGQNYQTLKKFNPHDNLGVGMRPLPLAPIVETSDVPLTRAGLVGPVSLRYANTMVIK